jgi:archaellum component FlaC
VQKKSISGIFHEAPKDNKKSLSARKPPASGGEEKYLGRLNQQDKKLKSLEEKVSKVVKDFDVVSRKLDARFESQVKSVQQAMQGAERKDLGSQVNELVNSQKALIGHIHTLN